MSSERTFQDTVLADLGQDPAALFPTLHSDETRVTDIFRGTTEQLRMKTATRPLSIIAQASVHDPSLLYRTPFVLGRGLRNERGAEPTDTELLHDADPSIRTYTHDVIRAMMLPGSGLASGPSAEHFQEAIARHREGQSVSFELYPHTSELDPVFVETILEDLANRTADASLRTDIQEFLAKDIMVIGHKVFLSNVRRLFARAIRSVFTVAPKYREGLSTEEKELVTEHSRACTTIVKGIRSSAKYLLMLCPEGGRTVAGNIGVHPAVGMGGGYRVPLFLDMPPNFLGLDATDPAASRRSRVTLYCGKPFESDRYQNYIPSVHASLSEAGAPVENYSWGTKAIDRQPAVPIDKRKGAPEQFQSQIERRRVA